MILEKSYPKLKNEVVVSNKDHKTFRTSSSPGLSVASVGVQCLSKNKKKIKRKRYQPIGQKTCNRTKFLF